MNAAKPRKTPFGDRSSAFRVQVATRSVVAVAILAFVFSVSGRPMAAAPARPAPPKPPTVVKKPVPAATNSSAKPAAIEPSSTPEAQATSAPVRRLSPEGKPVTTLIFPKPTPIDRILLKIKLDTGANVTAVGKAKGQTIPGPTLKDVTVEEALRWIAAQKDWVWYQDKTTGGYVICDRQYYEKNVLKTQVVQRVIHPKNISAEDARKAVERMITPNVGSITADARTNQVIVTDLLPVVEAIERTIRLLDQKVFVRVFTIKNADPKTVFDFLQEYKSPPGRLVLNPQMRQIIAEDTYENIQRMEVMVDILDRGPEMRVYDLNDVDFEGKSLEDLKNYLSEQIITQGAYLQFDPKNGVMILIDLPSVHEKVKKILEAVDRPARQVYIQADIVETRFSHEFKLGIDYMVADDLLTPPPTLTGGGSGPPPPGTSSKGSPTFPWSGTPFQRTADTTDKNLGFSDIAIAGTAKAIHDRYPVFTGGSTGIALDYLSRHARLRFNAVMSDSETRILAQPRLLVKNRQPADFTDGGTLPYVTTTYYGGGYAGYGGYGGAYSPYIPSVAPGSVPTGVTLSVEPSIMNNGLIDLHITLTNVSGDLREVTSFDRTVEVPQTSNQTLDTTLVIPDGQTRMIGGMIENRESNSVSGIPFLKDIPVLGPVLFGSSKRSPTRRTLLMFITPSIVQERARKYRVPPDEDEKTPPSFYEQASWSAAAVKRAVEAALEETKKKYPTFEFPSIEETTPAATTPSKTTVLPVVRLEHALTTPTARVERGEGVKGEAPISTATIEQLLPPVLPPPTSPTLRPILPPAPQAPTTATFPTTGAVLFSPGPPPVLLSARRPSDLPEPRPREAAAGALGAGRPAAAQPAAESSYQLVVVGPDGRAISTLPTGQRLGTPALGTIRIPIETLTAVAPPSKATVTRRTPVRRTPVRRTPRAVPSVVRLRGKPQPKPTPAVRRTPSVPTRRLFPGGRRVFPSTRYSTPFRARVPIYPPRPR